MDFDQLPKVVIVGSVNSGKSTLFNRLVGFKKAVTSKIPGTTLDWISQIVYFKNKPVLLIDTAGFLEREKSAIEKKIKKFWEQIVSQAQVFLLIVDSKKGPLPQDKKILNYLRQFKTPIILVINKVDNLNLAEEKKRQFSEFSCDNTICISALLNKNISLLKEKIASYIQTTKHKKQIPLRIAIIGRPNVGKSTLLNALIRQERALVDKASGTTRDELEAPLNRSTILIDTPGLKRKSKIRSILEFFSSQRSLYMLKKADILIFLIDATEGLVHQEIKIASLIKKANKKPIIVINKTDLVSQQRLKQIKDDIKSRLYFLGEFKILEISALFKQNLSQLREETKKALVYTNF